MESTGFKASVHLPLTYLCLWASLGLESMFTCESNPDCFNSPLQGRHHASRKDLMQLLQEVQFSYFKYLIHAQDAGF